jgi:phosphoribosylanthranilate isomerase
MGMGLRVIKVFRVGASLPNGMADFTESADLFLFDTDTEAYGGSGRKFDWELLRTQEIPLPYLLSGGIAADDVEGVARLDLPRMIGIDVNSRFETAPGVKNIEMIKRIIPRL